jgi:hypothetical protein
MTQNPVWALRGGGRCAGAGAARGRERLSAGAGKAQTACGTPATAGAASGLATAAQERAGSARTGGGARPPGSVRAIGGPARGFGRMWEKTYTMTLEGISPTAAIAPWQDSFPWPVYRRRDRGVAVLHADADSVTVSTLPAEPLAGWITVRTEDAGPLTDVRVHALMRARDPLSELAFVLGGHRRQDRFWVTALTALAAELGLPEPAVVICGVCLDSRHQWRNTRNVCHGPVLRGLARAASVPCLVLGLGLLSPRTRRRSG